MRDSGAPDRVSQMSMMSMCAPNRDSTMSGVSLASLAQTQRESTGD